MAVRRLFFETFCLYCILQVTVYIEDGNNKLIKTEYNSFMRMLVFIISSKRRFFSPVSWVGALLTEIMFFCQAMEIFVLGSDADTMQYTIHRIRLGGVLLIFFLIINLAEERRKYIEYKKNKGKGDIWEIKKAEIYNVEKGRIIRQLYYNKTASVDRYGTVLILSYSHNSDPNGDYCIKGQRKEIKMDSEYGYAWEHDIHCQNIMAYEELADFFNRSGYDVIRFRVSPEVRNEAVETFCGEIKSMVEKLDINDVLLVGHGVQGCIEAEILSTYIKTSAMILLSGAGVEILESRWYEYVKLFISGKYRPGRRDRKEMKKYFEKISELEAGEECGSCSMNCEGCCQKCVTPYFDSMRKYKKSELKNIIKEYPHKMLIVYAKEATDYNAKMIDEFSSFDFEKIKQVELDGVYETFRKPKVRDYRYYPEIYLLKDGDDREIDVDLINILSSFLDDVKESCMK